MTTKPYLLAKQTKNNSCLKMLLTFIELTLTSVLGRTNPQEPGLPLTACKHTTGLHSVNP